VKWYIGDPGKVSWRCSKSAAESAVQISLCLQNRHPEGIVIAMYANWNVIGIFLKRIESDTHGIKKAANGLYIDANRISDGDVSAAASIAIRITSIVVNAIR